MHYLLIAKDLEPVLIHQAVEDLPEKQKKCLTYLSDVASWYKAILESQSPSLFDAEHDKASIAVFILTPPLYDKLNKLKAFESLGSYKAIKLYPVSLKQFPLWLEKRFKKANILLSAKLKAILVDYFEGNISAAVQYIQQLKTVFSPSELTEEIMLKMLIPSAKYSVFDLIDHLSPAPHQAAKVIQIMNALEGEGVEPVLVLWALSKKCREKQWAKLLPLLVKADRIIKGIEAGKAWESLRRIALLYTQKEQGE